MQLHDRARAVAATAVVLALVALSAIAAPPGDAAPAAQSGPATRWSFGAVADDYARKGVSRRRAARGRRLRIDGRPRTVTHLRFDLRRLAGRTVTAAALRVYALRAARTGFVVHGGRGRAGRSGPRRRGRRTPDDGRGLVRR